MSMDTRAEAADWIPFPGGELEGTRPAALCSACRDALRRAAWRRGSAVRPRRGGRPGVLCFQCYRAGLERARSIQAAGNLDTASDARFQVSLPFEPVNQTRLAMLKVERLTARAHARTANGGFAERRRRAQIAARHAIQRITRGLVERRASREESTRVLAAAAHAAELQLPAVWLPFVMSR